MQKSGKWEEKEVNKWNNNQLLESIYCPGVSTMTKVNTGAGRGVGMDIIKNMVTKSGGEIEIKTEESKYTLFKISFPIIVNKTGKVFSDANQN